MRRGPLTLLAAVGVACGGVRIPAPGPVFPLSTAWSVKFEAERLEGDLATDGVRLFAATRHGRVRALDPATGAVLWAVENRLGRVSADPTTLVVRKADGVVERLDPGSGESEWRVRSGVDGPLAAVIAGHHVLVAGKGLAALDLDSGESLWTASETTQATALPVVVGDRVLVPEAGGVLRARSLSDGKTLWTFSAGGEILASPTADAGRRVFVGTMAPEILALDLRNGSRQWRWKRGAGVRTPATLLDGRLLIATFESVLFALKQGSGDIIWRSPLPSRPWSGPVLVGSAVLIACHETEMVGFDGRDGRKLGGLKLPTAFATQPLALERTVFVGLRGEATVVALRLAVPGASPSPGSSPSPGASPSPEPSPSPASPALPSPTPDPSATPSPQPRQP